MAKRFSNRSNALFSALLLLTGLCSCQKNADTDRNTVHIFAAASLKEVLEEIGSGFTASSGLAVSYNFAGSNVLAQQIVASSRADLFISADVSWMDHVEREGRLGEETRIDLLENKLVIVCPLNSFKEITGPESLCELEFEFLCMGDPRAVPAGRYAREFLSSIDCGSMTAWENVREKVSPTPDVRAALAQVLSQREAIAFVYRTDFLLYRDQLRLLFEAADLRITYPAAMTSNGMEKQAAGRFFLYLQSEEARIVFSKYGFITPDRAQE